MIRIAITGPECSGKSTLAFELAKHFAVVPALEYAVEYLEKTSGRYSLSDLDIIAEGQLRAIEAVSSQDVVIADTEMLVMKIWSEFKYGSSNDFINTAFDNQNFDIYFLCKPDIPYETSKFRENPNEREELFVRYEDALQKSGRNYLVISGGLQSRIESALYAISQLQKG